VEPSENVTGPQGKSERQAVRWAVATGGGGGGKGSGALPPGILRTANPHGLQGGLKKEARQQRGPRKELERAKKGKLPQKEPGKN